MLFDDSAFYGLSGTIDIPPPDLVALVRDHLIHAWCSRMSAAESALVNRVKLSILRRDPSVLVMADPWHTAGLPFNRIFDYRPPLDGLDDSLLLAAGDAVVEVMPGGHESRAATVLQAAGFVEAWTIPWLVRPLVDAPQATTNAITRLDPTDLAAFVAVWNAGYGTPDNHGGRLFTEIGFTAPGFACFLACVEDQPAAVGVVHVDGVSALVDGATTLPAYRGLGLQKALLAARLEYARSQGARIAFSRTGAGSVSERNLRTLGFQPLVASVAWRLKSALG